MTDSSRKHTETVIRRRRKNDLTPKRKAAQGGQKFSAPAKGERIAKVIARSGMCSRREAEQWIADGRVAINGQIIVTPAVTVTDRVTVTIDGEPLPDKERTRLWLYHKPRGLVTTTADPEGRKTIFQTLPRDLPRVMSIGRLDINTEGLLLLTNDGGLKRVLELPETGWLRRYRVRAYGKVTQAQLDALKDGIVIDGIQYGSIDAKLDRVQGDNNWITMAFSEGKNREVKVVLGALGLEVNRLLRLSYGPFMLGDMVEGAVSEIPTRILQDQLGKRLAEAASVDFDAPNLDEARLEAKGLQYQPKQPRGKAEQGTKRHQSKPGSGRGRAPDGPRRGGRDEGFGDRRPRRDGNDERRRDGKPFGDGSRRTRRDSERGGPRAAYRSDDRDRRQGGDKPLDMRAGARRPWERDRGEQDRGDRDTGGGNRTQSRGTPRHNARGGQHRGGPNRSGPSRHGPDRGGPDRGGPDRNGHGRGGQDRRGPRRNDGGRGPGGPRGPRGSGGNRGGRRD